MAGCDFLPSLPGIGIKRAYQHLKRTRCFLKVSGACLPGGARPGRARLCTRALQPWASPTSLLNFPPPAPLPILQAVQALKWDGGAVPGDYLRRFQRAIWVFRHQRVYCEREGVMRSLTLEPEGGLAAGALIPEAAQVCRA